MELTLKATFLLLATSLFWPACRQASEVEVLDDRGRVRERYFVQGEDSLRVGTYSLFDTTGKLVEEAVFKDGMLHGKRIFYYPDGSIQYEQHHVLNRFEGPFRSFYPDGTPEISGQYTADQMSGVWTYYNPDGSKKEEVTFSENLENGPFREWYPDGTLKAEGSYLGGDYEHGLLTLYTPAGTLDRRMHCVHGACTTIRTDSTSGRYD